MSLRDPYRIHLCIASPIHLFENEHTIACSAQDPQVQSIQTSEVDASHSCADAILLCLQDGKNHSVLHGASVKKFVGVAIKVNFQIDELLAVRYSYSRKQRLSGIWMTGT